MQKSATAFLTIGEVADALDLPQHVLRYWETRFTQIKPIKKQRGRRYYRPDDVDLLRGIRFLLYSERFTIRGVQRILAERGKVFVASCWQHDRTGTPVWQKPDQAPHHHKAQQTPLSSDGPHPSDTHFKVGNLLNEAAFNKLPTTPEQATEMSPPNHALYAGLSHVSPPAPPEMPQSTIRPATSWQKPAEQQISQPEASETAPPLSQDNRAHEIDNIDNPLQGEVDRLKSLLVDLRGMRDNYRKLEQTSPPSNVSKTG